MFFIFRKYCTFASNPAKGGSNSETDMGFLKSLFGGKDESPEEKKRKEEAHDFDVLKTDGVRALRMGQGEHAVKCFDKALEIKEDLETRDYLSQALIRCDRLAEARKQLEILAEAEPDNVRILLMMARVDYLMENYNAMAMVCEKATLLDNENAEVMFLYARAMKGQRDLVNAVAMFTKTIMLDEQFADAYLERGRLLLEMGDVEGAEEDADHLMEHAPGVEEVMLFKADVLVAQKRQGEAISIYDKAIETNPFCISALKGRGAVRLAIGDKEGAMSDMRQVLDIDPGAFDHLNGRFEG